MHTILGNNLLSWRTSISPRVSLGTDGSPKSVDSAILTDSKTALHQKAIALRTEDQWLRQQLAAQQEQIDDLQAGLERYKNARTPSNKKGGAGGDRSDHDDSDDDKTNH